MKGVITWDGGSVSEVYLVLWSVLVTFTLIWVLILSCAEGASKVKTSAADSTQVYGSACAAECGAACGG
ncbi:hypothetical protein RHMOL_Rhmol12G0164600 [Rhododendron molle]|uniref:Uncharacterized protein n=1 Tax=Rhododendron molle TaxID=49168 RepID=A0ACC0LJF4_RHOML|nr:hypothetical protein RHMOL_Rhmol12G0164600 [Rhododendron molle]